MLVDDCLHCNGGTMWFCSTRLHEYSFVTYCKCMLGRDNLILATSNGTISDFFQTNVTNCTEPIKKNNHSIYSSVGCFLTQARIDEKNKSENFACATSKNQGNFAFCTYGLSQSNQNVVHYGLIPSNYTWIFHYDDNKQFMNKEYEDDRLKGICVNESQITEDEHISSTIPELVSLRTKPPSIEFTTVQTISKTSNKYDNINQMSSNTKATSDKSEIITNQKTHATISTISKTEQNTSNIADTSEMNQFSNYPTVSSTINAHDSISSPSFVARPTNFDITSRQTELLSSKQPLATISSKSFDFEKNITIPTDNITVHTTNNLLVSGDSTDRMIQTTQKSGTRETINDKTPYDDLLQQHSLFLEIVYPLLGVIFFIILVFGIFQLCKNCKNFQTMKENIRNRLFIKNWSKIQKDFPEIQFYKGDEILIDDLP